ncbi:hypothetical protein AVEN_57687-1 [Araneus ventricosus]|uniref:Uncharacterized protein n=1 Tax=Araneus ventricosus TaxID=182803 RepID=A0A4Y2LCV6_ARAVE|nr:hypothetical protein AVEN_57687-1 [Araneus ventricosus]
MDLFSLPSTTEMQITTFELWMDMELFMSWEECSMVTPTLAFQTCSCIPPWNGARLCPTRGPGLPDRGHDLLYGGEECNEIGLKLSPDYYLSTTVEYPVQKFSPPGSPFPF